MHCTRAPNFRPNHNISAFFIHFIFQRIVLLTWSKTSQEKRELILALVLWVFFFFSWILSVRTRLLYSIHSVHWHSMRVLPTGFVATNVCGCRFCHTETFALPTMSNETKLRLLFDVFSQLFFFCCGCCCCCRCCRCRCHLVKLCCRSDSTIHNAKTNAGKQAAAAK